MIPQVAFRPQLLLEQFPNYGYPVTPYQSTLNPRDTGGSVPLPSRNQRTQSSHLSAVPQPQHHTYNVGSQRQQYGLAQVALSGKGLRGQYHDASEHMLRRKTPNGTLAAGYDGTPVPWSSRVPALKHVVLPSSGGTAAGGSTFATENPYREQREQSQLEWGRSGGQFRQMNISDTQLHLSNGGMSGWTQGFSPLDSSSALLSHIPIHQSAAFYPYNSMQVPTVLQPAYQPAPGPLLSASNDTGPYGPYWPNGKFVPYRPAAIRGHGYHHMGYETGINYSILSEQVKPGIETLQAFHQPNQALDFSQRNSIIYHSQTHKIPQLFGSAHASLQESQLFPNTHLTNAQISDGSRTPTLHSASRTSNVEFKEKTLSWAHSIYVDLLDFLHKSNRESKTGKSLNGIQSYSKNGIYPKPPRQSTASLGYSQLNAFAPSGNSDGGVRYWQANTGIGETRHTRHASQDTPHYLSAFQPSHVSSITPIKKAHEALDMLTTLCEQSNWSWIDGMLLGGCLAYGLEEYGKALDWYSKIIDLDPRHVEAMSNLAATLLCLNRREEAEQHWLQAVRLRPSYFEAVEHLIGLLCGDHRAKEAVDIIDFVERSLRLTKTDELQDYFSETSSNADREAGESLCTASETVILDYDYDDSTGFLSPLAREIEENSMQPGFGTSGFSIPGSENGRLLALTHAKGNMLYALGDIDGASKAFENAVLISTGRDVNGIQGLIQKIISVLSYDSYATARSNISSQPTSTRTPSPLLLPPSRAVQTARLVFAKNGELPNLRFISQGLARRAAISTTSNSLLSLAKIFQDAMSNSTSSPKISRMPSGIGDILALYYLSLSLQPSPSTANNVGILLASVQQPASYQPMLQRDNTTLPEIPGVVPGSGVALALAYYNYGLNLDARHAHLYTNLGSLLKDIGQLSAAIKMYEQAVACDGTFDIALANLANAVKDQGRTSEAIKYYRRAVEASPDFAEAVCGLANALNSVCDWAGRGGVVLDGGTRDRWHVDEAGMFTESSTSTSGSGWMKRVVDIVAKQLQDGALWGCGILQGQTALQFLRQLELSDSGGRWSPERRANMHSIINSWVGQRWEGARVVRLVERAIKRSMHRWYEDKYIKKVQLPPSNYARPQLPANLSVPTAPTVLPFHTFTCPLSAKDIRMISQRNALRISCSTLRAPWMQGAVFPPPPPPSPTLNIGYVSSDFNNHPLAHLMQSVFGFHDISRAKAFCYATTASDNSIHRQQIEREAPVFRDASSWSADHLVHQILEDGIHILVNLNGYTRGARNEIFAARPAPIQMSFMGFAGTLGAEWCDYLLADETAIPPDTLRPWRRNLNLDDQFRDDQSVEEENWVYSENIIFCRDTFFCCDHAQSEPRANQLSWEGEESRRWRMRKELFPSLADDAIILGNFNQLYKIEPTTFRTWLRILDKVPKAILWLLRFPDLGEANLKRTAREWAGEGVASRIWFTDVAPKHLHISRARVCDLFLDTPECNAHTTAADILWSSTPLLTLPRYKYKMCSRMAASILRGALPKDEEGRKAAAELIAKDDEQYEEFAIRLANGFSYTVNDSIGKGNGRLNELRKLLYNNRWTCALFNTRRWVSDLESAYEEAWRRWVMNEGGDIYL
ncbi:hypothetical protein B7463_g5348, partial [Scytalidium lignicola]